MESVEYDSEDEDATDAGAELSSWVQKLTAGTDTAAKDCASLRGGTGKCLLTQSDTVESFRYSVMMDLDSSNACDLDDIINDLCALEAQLTSECSGGSQVLKHARGGPAQELLAATAADEAYESRSSTASSANSSLSRESGTRYLHEYSAGRRATLPVSPAASAVSRKSSSTKERTPGSCKPTAVCEEDGPADTYCAVADTRTKDEKIRLAIQKIKDADIKKLFVKVFIENGDCKTLLIDENMSTYEVVQVLFDKCPAFKANVRWAVIEQIPDLLMERIIEDHEKLVMVMLNWLKVSNNRVLFLQTDDKYDLFFQPQNYLLEKKAAVSCNNERDQKGLIDDLFSGAGCQVPEIESDLHVKVDGQKSWKKITAVLRGSGIYLKKGKTSRAPLQNVVRFEQMEAYRGFNWKKKHKAPSEHCFALKRPDIQRICKDGSIKYFCCDDDYTLKRWLTGIRIAKYGSVLNDNFKKMLDLVATSNNGDRGDGGLAVSRAETASHSSRDSGFSIASGGSSGSLDGSNSASSSAASSSAATSAQPLRSLPPPPVEFSDLPPPPPELLRSACSTPATPKRCIVSAATGSPVMHHGGLSDGLLTARDCSSTAGAGSSRGLGGSGRAASLHGASNTSTPRNSGSSSISSSSSMPCSSVQSLNAGDLPAMLPSVQQQQPPAIPSKPRINDLLSERAQPQLTAVALAYPATPERTLQSVDAPDSETSATTKGKLCGNPPQPRNPFDRSDPSRKTCPCPVTPKRPSFKQPVMEPSCPGVAKQRSIERSDVFPYPTPVCHAAGRPATASKPANALPTTALARQPSMPCSSADSIKLAAVADSPVSTSNGKLGFLAELNNVYAKRGIAKPSEPQQISSHYQDAPALCDIDDLPPPPPELLLDLPQATSGLSLASPHVYDEPYLPCSVGKNGSSDKLHYNMGHMFASQTGTIKRAPPPPPKRHDMIVGVADNAHLVNQRR